MTSPRPSVLVLGGGPDAEREISIISSEAVAEALRSDGRFEVHFRLIDRPTAAELAELPGDVVFPVLHGRFGEGGPLQDLLDQNDRLYVGSGPSASRLAMDKIATKHLAAQIGVPTTASAVLDPLDPVCPLDGPVVVKPVREGSSVGLYLCNSAAEWAVAHAAAAEDVLFNPARVYLIEPLVAGRELTVGVYGALGALRALPTIEIAPAEGVYDYAAKYTRGDTDYTPNPDLPDNTDQRLKDWAVAIAEALGVRHLARVDFMLGDDGPVLLEVNTMPGFTPTSLYPKAAHAEGRDFGMLCGDLVELALARAAATV